METKKEIELVIPEGWNEITVEQFQHIQMLDKNKFKSNLNYLVNVLAIVTGVDKSVLMEADAIELTKITDEIKWITKEPEADKKEIIEYDGVKYKFKSSLNNLSVGEMVSIEQVIDLEALNIEMAFDVVLAILLREVKEDGSLEDFNADEFEFRRKHFAGISITDVIGSLLFFSDGEVTYTKDSKGCSKFKIIKKKK